MTSPGKQKTRNNEQNNHHVFSVRFYYLTNQAVNYAYMSRKQFSPPQPNFFFPYPTCQMYICFSRPSPSGTQISPFPTSKSHILINPSLSFPPHPYRPKNVRMSNMHLRQRPSKCSTCGRGEFEGLGLGGREAARGGKASPYQQIHDETSTSLLTRKRETQREAEKEKMGIMIFLHFTYAKQTKD